MYVNMTPHRDVPRRFELYEDVRRARRERLVRKIEEERRAQCPFRPQINSPPASSKRTKTAARRSSAAAAAAAEVALDKEEEEEEEEVLEREERLYEEVRRLLCDSMNG